MRTLRGPFWKTSSAQVGATTPPFSPLLSALAASLCNSLFALAQKALALELLFATTCSRLLSTRLSASGFPSTLQSAPTAGTSWYQLFRFHSSTRWRKLN